MPDAIRVEIKGLEAVRQPLNELSREMPKIIKAAANKGVKAARTEAAKHITSRFTVKKRDLFTGASHWKRSDKLKIALVRNMYAPVAMLYAEGQPGLRYTQFKHTVTKKGVNVWERRGAKMTLKHAFKSKFWNSSAEGIFWREHAGKFPGSTRSYSDRQFRAMGHKYRLPVEHLRGFTAAQMLDDGDGVKKAAQRGEEVFRKEVDRLIDQRLGGIL